jgi:hypothetical protein
LDGVVVTFPDGPRLRADDGLDLPIPAAVRAVCSPGQVLAVGTRPGDVAPVVGGAAPPTGTVLLPGWRVTGAERVGPGWLVGFRQGRWEWRAWWPGESPPESGAAVGLSIPETALEWFDGLSGRALGC